MGEPETTHTADFLTLTYLGLKAHEDLSVFLMKLMRVPSEERPDVTPPIRAIVSAMLNSGFSKSGLPYKQGPAAVLMAGLKDRGVFTQSVSHVVEQDLFGYDLCHPTTTYSLD